MKRSKPSLNALGELAPGQFADFFSLLIERTRGETRDGKPYFNCRFSDAKRTVSFMVWMDSDWFESCSQDWRVGQFFKIRGTFVVHERYGPQIEVQNIRRTVESDREDGFNPAQFVDHSRYDVEKMFGELLAIAGESIQDKPLRRLVLTILERHREALKRLPATRHRFFPFFGGLLEHILSVTHSCMQLADKYIAHYPDLQPPLNRDLIVAAAILHDIGRVLELNDDVVSPQPTVPGRLLGHLFLGRDMVRDTAKELGDINPELVQLLEHLIVSHLNLPEWGSPRLPLIPESLIIHHADDLDAKMEMYTRCLIRDKEEGPFTARDPGLNRQLYKGRRV